MLLLLSLYDTFVNIVAGKFIDFLQSKEDGDKSGLGLCCKRFCNSMLQEFSPNEVMPIKVICYLFWFTYVIKAIHFLFKQNNSKIFSVS